METSATDDEVAEISAALTEAGIPAKVLSDTVKGGGAGAINWTLLISIPATAYFAKLASELATDSYNALKRTVGRIHEARKAAGVSMGEVTFVDEEADTTFNLPPELPEDAWRALSEKRPEEYSDIWVWDPTTGQWRDFWKQHRP